MLPERWAVIEIDVSPEKEEEIRQWCRERSGLKYDWLGILGCGLWFRRVQSKVAWYCSEICITALKRAKILKLRSRISPNAFYRRLKRGDALVNLDGAGWR
jgi:hypothetical protein